MSRYDIFPAFERSLVALHVRQLITDLDVVGSSGIEMILVPPGTDAELWYAEAVRVIRDLQDGVATTEDSDFADPPKPAAVAVRSLDGVGLDTRGDARLLIVIAASDSEHLTHESLAYVDRVTQLHELDADLVVAAAAECGRTLTRSDAEDLARMPWRRRKLAYTSRRPISESYEHYLASKSESKEVGGEDEKPSTKIRRKTTPRRVPDVRPLEDLHGYGTAKVWGLELAQDVADWQRGDIAWSDVDNGVLLSGPPGCGKTTFAAALARTVGAHFVSGSYSEWQSHGHQGDMLGAMRKAFEEARLHAPSVLLIDEIDGFVSRSVGGQSDDYLRGVVNGLLELLDGSYDRTGIIVVGATNAAEIVDAAIKRSGRLDRHIEIPLPDTVSRMAILRQHLGVEIDLGSLTEKTSGMSGADLERVARDARRRARRQRVDLDVGHIVSALPHRVARSPEALRALAVHEIGHAVVGAVLGREKVDFVFMTSDYDPDAAYAVAGGAANVSDHTAHRTRHWYADKACAMLGGLAAERMVYGDHGDGVIGDLEDVTNLMTFALASVGHGDTLASDGRRDPVALLTARQYDPGLVRRVDDALHEQAERARAILERYRVAFDRLVDLLIAHGRLDGSEVYGVIRACTPAQLALAI